MGKQEEDLGTMTGGVRSAVGAGELAAELGGREQMVEFLNSLIAIDPYAIAELLCARVPCNRALAVHPTVQVSDGNAAKVTYMAPGTFRVGMLGIINGFFGAIEAGQNNGVRSIVAVYEDGRLVRFEQASKTP